jgi:hypothetical protein
MAMNIKWKMFSIVPTHSPSPHKPKVEFVSNLEQ